MLKKHEPEAVLVAFKLVDSGACCPILFAIPAYSEVSNPIP
jgi:hypothetical protein